MRPPINQPGAVRHDGTFAGQQQLWKDAAGLAAERERQRLLRLGVARPTLQIPARPPRRPAGRPAAIAAGPQRPARRTVAAAPAPAPTARAAAVQTAATTLAEACQAFADGRFPAALTRFRRLANGAILADEGHFGLACLAVRGGDLLSCRSHLVRALAVNPAHKAAKAALTKVDRRLAAGEAG